MLSAEELARIEAEADALRAVLRAPYPRADHDRSPPRDVFSRHSSTVAADDLGRRVSR